MKNLLNVLSVFLCLIIISPYINAQHTQIKWGPELEGKGIVSLLGEHGDFIYASRAQMKTFGGAKTSFIKIDKTTLQIVDEKPFKSSKKDGLPLHTSFDGDKVVFLMLIDKEIRKSVYDFDLNEISSEVFITLKDTPTYLGLFANEENPGIPGDIISIIESRDQSKVAIRITKPSKHKVEILYHVVNVADGYTHLYHTDFILDKKNKLELIKDTDIESDGTMNLLVKQYNNKKGKEFKNKKPDYNFSIIKIDTDGEIQEIDLPNQTHFWKGSKITESKDGSILVTAMTQAKPKGGADGFQIIKIGSDNSLVFDKSHPIKNNDGKEKLDKSYGVKDFISINDDLYIVMSENGVVKSANRAINNSSPKYLVEDVLFDGFDGEGNHLWSERIYRDVVETFWFTAYSQLKVYYNDEGLSIYYNTTEKNSSPLNKEKQKAEKLPNKKNVIVHATLSTDGKFSFGKVSSGNKLNFLTLLTRQLNNRIYFIGTEKSDLQEMTLGVVER